jgi:hypothetical protein
MTIRRFTPRLAVMPVLAGAVLLLVLAAPAAAQTEACLQVLAGSGTPLTLQVYGVADDVRIKAPRAIPPGQTQCVPLGKPRQNFRYAGGS